MDLRLGKVRRVLSTLRRRGANNRLIEVALASLRLFLFPMPILLELFVSCHDALRNEG
jgi:hypothetical protein